MSYSKYIEDIRLLTTRLTQSKDSSVPNYARRAEKLQRFKKITDYTDSNRDFKDIMTKFVVVEFYKTDQENANFIQLVTDIFDNMINAYCLNKNIDTGDILFLYKGGNVLRVLALEAMNSQPGEMKDKLMAAYEQYFKKSDADFTIYINPNMDEAIFREIYDDLSVMTYICLNYIRAIFYQNLPGHFSYARLSTQIKKEILTSYLKKLNESPSLKDPSNEFNGGKFISLKLGNEEVGKEVPVTLNPAPGTPASRIEESADEKKINFGSEKNGGRQDHLIVDDAATGELVYFTSPIINFFEKYNMLQTEEGKRMLKFILGPLGRTNSSSIYVSYNSTLDFAKSKFNLMRAKVNFASEFQTANGQVIKKNLNGELIDVSIIDLKTLKLPGMSVHEDLSRVRQYTDSSLGIKMQFKSYSLKFFIHDLVFIIFENAEYPWDDRKYAKRLARLFFLYLIDMMDRRYGLDIVNRITFVRVLKSSFNSLKEKIDELLKNSNIFDKGEMQAVFNNIKSSTVQYDYLLKDIINHVMMPLQKISNFTGDPVFIQNCNNFLEDVLHNLNVMDIFLAGLQNFIQSDGLMNQSDLYSFQQLGGMDKIYYQKYLKYRQKYMNLKNQMK
ncbi:hypothetical protein CPAV1605_1188 [seawater metagenome]|uniref:Uncharacterized protein n=1 Tax=seawater metagenome TaxID=1561972 RepID=A0A5E8CK54_9ZZZZ